jgi:hypothetical protein
LFGGNYSFKTVGLSKQMAYSVRIYVASWPYLSRFVLKLMI